MINPTQLTNYEGARKQDQCQWIAKRSCVSNQLITSGFVKLIVNSNVKTPT